MANDVMIEVKNLSKMYGGFRALDRVSFQVRRGEVVGFLGPNGAGKSTTMRILTCFLSASDGVARVHGIDVFDNPLEVRRKLGYLPQRAPLYGEMRVWDYLRFCADMRGLSESTFKSRMKRVVEVCGLAKVLGKDIRTLSHGYRQRVGLGQALVHEPPILILDEPTSDLDPNEKAEVIRYIQEIGKNHTVLLSTHNLNEVEAACARAIIVSKGRVVADGPLDEIRAKSGVGRYVITVEEKRARDGFKAPSAQEAHDALRAIKGVTSVQELPTDDRAHTFQLNAPHGVDLRADLFQLILQKGWMLLEMRRESQTLEDVFKALTRGDERADRGLAALVGESFSPDADDDEDDEDEDEDEDEAEDEKPVAKAPAKSPPKEEPKKAPAKAAEEDEDDEEEDEDEDEDDEEEEEEEKPAAKKGAKK